MTNFTDLPSGPPDHLVPFTDQLRLAVAAYLARFKGSSATTRSPTCAASWPGAPERDLDPLAARRPHLELYPGGCRRSAGSSPPRSRGGSRSLPGSTGPVSSMACWTTCSAIPSSRAGALSHLTGGTVLAVCFRLGRAPRSPGGSAARVARVLAMAGTAACGHTAISAAEEPWSELRYASQRSAGHGAVPAGRWSCPNQPDRFARHGDG
jgi:hypothetical protein